MLTGEMLRAARAMARLDQAQLADEAGVSLETIKRLERIHGAINANPRTAAALIEALGRHDIRIEQHVNGALCLVGPGVLPAAERNPAAPPVTVEPADLHRLIYFSTAAFDPTQAQSALDAILATSTGRNSDLGVGGALTYADGRFMQALEGSRVHVQELYASIIRDPRHRRLVILENRAIGARRFPNWVMCARVVTKSEMARADASQADGFRPELLSPAAGLGLLAWISELELIALG